MSVKEHDFGDGTKYQFHPDHRGNRPDKCIWTISEIEELGIFLTADSSAALSYTSTGTVRLERWGIRIIDDEVLDLGLSRVKPQTGTRNTLYIGYFESADHVHWHGYPADPDETLRVTPFEDVIAQWLIDYPEAIVHLSRAVRGIRCKPVG